MSVAYFGCVLATPNAFGLLEYKALTDLVNRVEADLSFTDIIETYNNGTHPYFKYLSSILALSDADGDSFCGAMMRILQRFENKYPQAVVSNIALPSASMPESTGERSTLRGRLPQELLERIMSFCSTYDLKVSRMNTDWQFWVCTSEGKKNAELYAFAAECVVFYIASKWRFSRWVVSVSYFDWPSTPATFFYHAFPNVRSVVFHGKSCRLRNFPVIGFPRILPPSIHSLRIIRCSLRGHSVEYLLSMCRNIRSVSLHSVYYGHVISPFARLSDTGDARSWLTMLGVFPTSPTGQFEYAPPSVRRLDLHFPDDPAPIRSTATDLRGTPPLLFQLFPEDPCASEQFYFLWDDKAFPVRLRSTVIDELEVRWTPHMAFVFPRVVRCTGNNLSTLSMFFPTTKHMRDTYTFCLREFDVLACLRVEVNARDVSHVLSSCSTWSSECRLQSGSVLAVVIYHATGPLLQTLDAIDVVAFSSVLCANKLNRQHSLHGRFQLSLRSPGMEADAGPDTLMQSPSEILRTPFQLFFLRLFVYGLSCYTILWYYTLRYLSMCTAYDTVIVALTPLLVALLPVPTENSSVARHAVDFLNSNLTVQMALPALSVWNLLCPSAETFVKLGDIPTWESSRTLPRRE
ncbi:hypothetical protein EDD18DRAFT_1117933 [Armillaria luteobubalina]|uniref:Uncharacterized protein n=1 Tax=Armillaria luteobubalina TaxID=153913 RepID=A0AA39T942_9AGAR|nr:hypothetical protein EDD18DRAFT_1117933 [Armillaria luteobubalina]